MVQMDDGSMETINIASQKPMKKREHRSTGSIISMQYLLQAYGRRIHAAHGQQTKSINTYIVQKTNFYIVQWLHGPIEPRVTYNLLHNPDKTVSIWTMEIEFKGNRSMEIINARTINTLYNNYHVQQLLQAYGQWVHDQMAYGWHGYLLSFMFSQIGAPDHERMEIMKKHLGWFYGRLAKASVPKPSSPKWSPLLPQVVLAPDLPVPKHSTVQLRDVTINNGSLARVSHGQSVGPEIAWKPGCSYQRESE
jgi:hypothetical protein